MGGANAAPSWCCAAVCNGGRVWARPWEAVLAYSCPRPCCCHHCSTPHPCATIKPASAQPPCCFAAPPPQLCDVPNLLLLRLRRVVVVSYLFLAAAFAWVQLKQLQVAPQQAVRLVAFSVLWEWAVNVVVDMLFRARFEQVQQEQGQQ